jgi:hypothetical protein
MRERTSFRVMVPQNITEQVLLDRLEELGGRVPRPYLATGVSQTADSAEVTLDSGDRIEGRVRRCGRRHEQQDPRPGRTWVRRQRCAVAVLHAG